MVCLTQRVSREVRAVFYQVYRGLFMKQLVLAAMLMAVSGTAMSAEIKEKGAYIGGAVGASEYDSDDITILENLGYSIDDSDVAVQLWGGYRFLRWFAVEGKLAHLGEYSATDGDEVIDLEAAAITANAVFIAPFGGSGWDFYGQVGLGSVSWEAKSSEGGKLDGNELVGTAGIGIRWTIVPSFTVSLGLDAYAWESDEESDNVDESVAITKLGLQYNF